MIKNERTSIRNAQEQPKEEYAIVLDFLLNGYSNARSKFHHREPIAQIIGEKGFSLLEIKPKKDVFLKPNDKVYIGEGKRDKVHHILGRIPFTKLTETAKSELPYILIEIEKRREKEFISFINKAQPISMRMHSLELLPGFGKKRVMEIVAERETKPFESFDDFKKRIKQVSNIEEVFAKRIIKEMKGNEKHYLFVK